MKKILHVSHNLPHQSNRMALQIGYAEDRFGVETLSLTDKGPVVSAFDARGAGRVPKELSTLKWWMRFAYPPYGNRDNGLFKTMGASLSKVFWTAGFLHREKYDVVHVHEHLLLWVAVIAVVLGRKVVWDPHDYFYEGFESGPLRWPQVKKAMESFLVHCKVPFLMVSSGMTESYLHMFPNVRCTLIRNFSLIRPDFREAEARTFTESKKAGGGDPLRLIYPGQIAGKRLSMAFIEAIAREDSMTLDIYGTNKWNAYLDEIKDKMETHAISNVFFKGAYTPEDLPGILKGYDYAVMPYHIDMRNIDYCLPNKFFQCVAAGIPLLISDMKELGGIVTDYGLGHVFRDGDYVEAVEKLKKWDRHSPEHEAMRANVKQYALTQMDYEGEKEKLLGIYEGLVLGG